MAKKIDGVAGSVSKVIMERSGTILYQIARLMLQDPFLENFSKLEPTSKSRLGFHCLASLLLIINLSINRQNFKPIGRTVS